MVLLNYRTFYNGNYCEMIIALNIDAERLKWNYQTSLHYKYTVFSPKAENDDDCYEYLHDYSEKTNRCIRIPSTEYWPLLRQGGSLMLYSEMHLLWVTYVTIFMLSI